MMYRRLRRCTSAVCLVAVATVVGIFPTLTELQGFPQAWTGPRVPSRASSPEVACAEASENCVGGCACDGLSRRRALSSGYASYAAAAVILGFALTATPKKAMALVAIKEPLSDIKQFDPPRITALDRVEAKASAVQMKSYEDEIADRKKKLFDRLIRRLPQSGAVVVEVGIGTFPNARYFKSNSKEAPFGIDFIGVDPNDSMEPFARRKATKNGLFGPERGASLRVVHGVAEALPLETGVADAVVCSLTLCAVRDLELAISEIKRVLKPGGSFLFWEHVLSNDQLFAEQQRAATPGNLLVADNCHFDRKTLEVIRESGFKEVDGEYFQLFGYKYYNPHAAGLAIA